MIYSDAIKLVTPFITKANATAYAAQVEKMLWVESNIMDKAGVCSSINSTFGEMVCEYIELEFDKLNNALEYIPFCTVFDETGLKFTRYYDRDSKVWGRFKQDCKGFKTVSSASAQMTKMRNLHHKGERKMASPVETIIGFGVRSNMFS